MDKVTDALTISIGTLNKIKNMTQIIQMAKTKEEMMLVLQTMKNELVEAENEIDALDKEAIK